jgi:poly(A) polymerase/tRNA nucleotidyltransferase (CCA-adding enzyme)
MTTLLKNIPQEVSHVTDQLEKKGFEAYLVGGCVRDILLGKKPKDWDVTTNATPEDIIAVFPKTFYENSYGTVGVVNEETADETLKIVEVTPYRIESDYTDKRRPDSVRFSKNIEDDLKRRDFTINALALGKNGSIVDLFKGQDDLKTKTIRAVGDAHARLSEDALRILRAVRLYAELGFHVEPETEKALKTHAPLLKHIAPERIREEFVRIIMSDEPMKGVEYCQTLGILPFIAPELEEGMGVEQNQAHSFDVWTHLLKTLQHSADKKYPLEIRLSAIFHDIGKPATRRFSHETNQYTFYGHEVVGAKMTKKILEKLKFSRETIENVTKFVRWHMFFSDTEEISLSAVRRMINNVGKDRIWDLMNLRVCDRIGTGRPKENPYRLRKYKAMVDEALRDPISVGLLKVDGKDIMDITKSAPGPKIGLILNALLEEALENPSINTKEFLVKRVNELYTMDEKDLKKLALMGKDKKDQVEQQELKEIRKKHKI